MRFLINVIDSNTGEATRDEMAEIDAFNDRLRADGHWVLACGVASPEQSTVINNRTGNPVVSEGPLHTSAEHVAGFWIIEAADREEALRIATEGSNCCNRKAELRPLLGG